MSVFYFSGLLFSMRIESIIVSSPILIYRNIHRTPSVIWTKCIPLTIESWTVGGRLRIEHNWLFKSSSTGIVIPEHNFSCWFESILFTNIWPLPQGEKDSNNEEYTGGVQFTLSSHRHEFSLTVAYTHSILSVSTSKPWWVYISGRESKYSVLYDAISTPSISGVFSSMKFTWTRRSSHSENKKLSISMNGSPFFSQYFILHHASIIDNLSIHSYEIGKIRL